MSNSFDLNLIPIVRYAGRDYPEMMGLHVAEPPRRPARGRGSDRLILYLNMQGNAPLAPGKQKQVLADLAKLYFESSGAVTSAMRVVAEQLNQVLLQRNKNIASSSRQAMGSLSQIVVRENRVYLSQSGSVHGFLIKESETLEFFDAELADRGLGQSRKTPIVYFQATLDANDTLLVASIPSPDWSSSTLTGFHGQGPESLRRRLFSQQLVDIHAVLIQARPGKGKFYLPRAVPVVGPSIEPEKTQPPTESDLQPLDKMVDSVENAAQTDHGEVVSEPHLMGDQQPIPIPTHQLSQTSADDKEIDQSVPPTLEDAPVEVVSSEDTLSPVDLEQPASTPTADRDSAVRSSLKSMAAVWAPISNLILRLFRGLRSLLARILPGEEFFTIPSTVMAFIAIAVPVVIVTIASVTYFSLGVDAQYELLYGKAEEMAIQAINQADLPQKRAELEAALRMLDQVETYRSDTPEVRTLQIELRSILDELDLVVRVDYQPAIVDGLLPTVNITQIVVSGNDLYLLDSNSGNVIRAELNGDLYYKDSNFQCGPNSSGGSPVGSLVKIAPWSPGFQPVADIIAIDNSGNILYCSKNDLPKVEQLAPPPADNWGNITSSSLDLGDYYVLDVPSNGVWNYRRSIFSEAPTQFFDAEIPQLDDVIDIAVNRDDLYLLHEDGRLTLCVNEGFEGVPTRCADVAYVDFRPGSENLPLIPASPFTQILYTQPPDPSLFFLEPQKHAIYHFSLRNLAFQRQYLPEKPLSNDEATAFTVDTVQRNLFLVIGNQVFHGIMP